MRTGLFGVVPMVLLAYFLNPAVSHPENGPQDVTYCQLAKDPSAFSGKRIRVTAIYTYMFELSALRAPTCCSDANHGAGIWVDFEDVPEGNARKVTKQFPKGMGYVLAVFVGRIETGSAYGTGQRVRFVVQQVVSVERKENSRHGPPAWTPVCSANSASVVSPGKSAYRTPVR